MVVCTVNVSELTETISFEDMLVDAENQVFILEGIEHFRKLDPKMTMDEETIIVRPNIEGTQPSVCLRKLHTYVP